MCLLLLLSGHYEWIGKLKDYMYRGGEEVCAGMCRALGDGAAPALGALLVDGLVDGLGRGRLVGPGAVLDG